MTAEKFSNDFYEAHGILTCPNGDKMRSDAEGMFCVVEGERVPSQIINGVVTLQAKPKAIAKGKKEEEAS
jgi:hypothetical protein